MEKEQIAALVQRAQAGDGQAVESLLRLAHTSVSYQCRKIMAHPQDAEDMTQEVLIKIYSSIGTLKEPEKFLSWANSIAARQCINERRRNPKDLQFAEDEEGHSMLDSLEELDEQKIPDTAIDNAETTRMIAELVDALPDAQRVCTYLFYYDQFSVKEIAEMVGVSENTIKSRLNYARKTIKDGVQDYEKKGVKLYGLSPLPFLLYFLRGAAESGADPQAAALMAKAAAGATAAGGTAAGGTAAGSAAAGAAGGLAVKITAGVLAGVLAVGGVGAAVSHVAGRKDAAETANIRYVEEYTESAAPVQVTPQTPVPTEEPEEPEKTPAPAEEPEETPPPTEEPVETPPPTEEPAETPPPTAEPIVTPVPAEEPAEIPDAGEPSPAEEITYSGTYIAYANSYYGETVTTTYGENGLPIVTVEGGNDCTIIFNADGTAIVKNATGTNYCAYVEVWDSTGKLIISSDTVS